MSLRILKPILGLSLLLPLTACNGKLLPAEVKADESKTSSEFQPISQQELNRTSLEPIGDRKTTTQPLISQVDISPAQTTESKPEAETPEKPVKSLW